MFLTITIYLLRWFLFFLRFLVRYPLHYPLLYQSFLFFLGFFLCGWFFWWEEILRFLGENSKDFLYFSIASLYKINIFLDNLLQPLVLKEFLLEIVCTDLFQKCLRNGFVFWKFNKSCSFTLFLLPLIRSLMSWGVKNTIFVLNSLSGQSLQAISTSNTAFSGGLVR